MNSEKLFRALGDIEEEKLEEAYTYNTCHKIFCIKYCSVAAGILLFIGIISYSLFISKNGSKNNSLDSSQNTNQTAQVTVTEIPNQLEGNNKAEQYSVINYNEREYRYTGEQTTKENIQQYLTDCMAKGIDSAGKVHEIDCVVFSVKNVSIEDEIAVEFGGIYYIYTIKNNP